MGAPRRRTSAARRSSRTPPITTSTEKTTSHGRAAAAPSASRRSWSQRQKETTTMKRLLFFAYGLTSYVIFLGTFLYAIAFVGGFGAGARLDGPLKTSLPAALGIDGALLMLFAAQHSIMARRWFKERWTKIVPPAVERSTYVLCASLALLLLF